VVVVELVVPDSVVGVGRGEPVPLGGPVVPGLLDAGGAAVGLVAVSAGGDPVVVVRRGAVDRGLRASRSAGIEGPRPGGRTVVSSPTIRTGMDGAAGSLAALIERPRP
jgi:hypothetical protein